MLSKMVIQQLLEGNKKVPPDFMSWIYPES